MLAHMLSKHSIEWRGVFSQGIKTGEAELCWSYRAALGSSTAEDGDDDNDEHQDGHDDDADGDARRKKRQGRIVVNGGKVSSPCPCTDLCSVQQ